MYFTISTNTCIPFCLFQFSSFECFFSFWSTLRSFFVASLIQSLSWLSACVLNYMQLLLLPFFFIIFDVSKTKGKNHTLCTPKTLSTYSITMKEKSTNSEWRKKKFNRIHMYEHFFSLLCIRLPCMCVNNIQHLTHTYYLIESCVSETEDTRTHPYTFTLHT